MTAATGSQTVRATVHLGIVDYLVKPVDQERLRQSLALFRPRMTMLAGSELVQHEVDRICSQPRLAGDRPALPGVPGDDRQGQDLGPDRRAGASQQDLRAGRKHGALTAGPDGNMWFVDVGAIGRITPSGQISEFTAGLNPGSMPSAIVAASDGNLWFTDQAFPYAIGRVTPGGTVTEHSQSDGLQTGAQPDAIIAGPDSNLWFDDQLSGSDPIGRVLPTGQIKEFPTADTPWPPVAGIDGDVWMLQSLPNAVLRVTPAGTITPFTDGLRAGADLIDTDSALGPDGNLWFVDKGTPTAIGRADVQLAPTASTGAAGALTTSSATVTGLPAGTTVYYRVLAANAYGTTPGAIQKFTTVAVAKPIPTPPPPKAPARRTTTATLGNQQVALTLPTACTARSRSLSIALSTATIPRSAAAKLRFVSAALYLDRGIRHVRTRHVHGKTRKVTTYTSNKVVRKLPARPSLRLAGLRSGRHTLKVRLLFDQRKTVPVRKTLSAKFRVC